jgi:hypothetical protein
MNNRLARPESDLSTLAPRPRGDAAAVRAFLGEAIAVGDVVPQVKGQAEDARPGPVPVVTYPDEWTFGSLRDAALLVLRLLRQGLAEGVMCTTGSAFDVQFHGMRPVLSAPGAFRPRKSGEGWPGQVSFCRTFLRPLLLSADHGIPFQPLLRGCPDGIAQAMVEHLAPGRRWSQRDLPGGLDGRATGSSWLDDRYPHPDPVEAMAEDLEGVVQSLDDVRAGRNGRAVTPYRLRRRQEPAAVVEARDRFVLDALVHARPATVLDLSLTDGRYARGAVEHRAQVISLDPDHRRAEQVHRSLRRYRCLDNRPPAITPLVAAGLGPFRSCPGHDRPTLAQRSAADLVLAVAWALEADWEQSATGPDPHDDPIVEILEHCAAAGAAAVLEVPSDRIGVVERQAETPLTIVRAEPLPLRPRTLLELRPTGGS